MKKIILTSLITIILLLSGFYVLAVIVNFDTAKDIDIFTEQDIKDTDMDEATFTANWLDINFDTDKNVFQIDIDYPRLKFDENDYRVERVKEALYYPLEIYNKCRNNGNTKVECVADAKERIKKQTSQFKERARDASKQIQIEIKERNETLNYTQELIKDDLIMTNTELNQ